MRNPTCWGKGGFSLQPWLPVAASTAIMAMVVVMAAENVKHLNKATQWRRRSADVIVSGQSFENNLLEIQRGMRGYVTLGDTNALNSFYRNVAVEPAQLRELQAYTANDASQQERLKALGTAMSALIAFDNKAIGTYRREGFAGIARLDATGQERLASGRARHILEQFCADEQRLWAERDAAEENQYHTTGELLIGGCAVAAILLLLAHSLAGSELRRRRRAEEKLRRTLLMQKAILDSADYGIVATDRDGIVQTFNRAAERLLGYSAEEVIGKVTPMLWRDPLEMRRQAEIFSEKTGRPVPSTFETILKKVELESVDEGEWTFIRKDGGRFPCLLVITG
ncbi:MAG: CHASE3 domain-containing protein, partial [Limisphaerales bacterium]